MGFDLPIGLSTGDAQVVSAVGLIVVSAVAAWFGFGAVREARRTREQAVRPALALDLVSVGALYAEIGIVNVGRGAALDADLTLSFLAADEGAESARRRWTWPLIQPGQRFQFAPPDADGKSHPNLGVWAPIFPRVTLTGTVRDSLGKDHRVDVELTDLPELRARAMDAGLASELRETSEARHLKTLSKSAGEISSRLGQIASALERRGPEGD